VTLCAYPLLKTYSGTDKGFHKGRSRAWIKRDQARCERLSDKIFEDKEVVGTTRVDDYPDVDIDVFRLRFELNSAEVTFMCNLIDAKRTKNLQKFANTYLHPELENNGEMWTAEEIRPYYEFNLKRIDIIETVVFGELDRHGRDFFGTET
jgi:hypothetical protein